MIAIILKETSLSLNQVVTPFASSKSCSSLAASLRSSQAWQRKTSRKSGNFERFSTFSRTGVSVRISAGVYKIVEPTGDQRAFVLVCPPPLLRLGELFDNEE